VTNARLLAEENRSPGISQRELVFHVPNYRVINAAACFRLSVVGNVRKTMGYRLIWTPLRARFVRQSEEFRFGVGHG
jgi:hypothetical protein